MTATVTQRAQATSTPANFFAELEAGRYGYGPMLLVVMVCLGGIAAAFAVQESEAKLMAVALSTVMVEILLVAVAPMRIIFWFAVVAFLIDLFVFIF